MVGVLVRGGKVLDDLASMGYVAAELASWVGPASPDAPQGVPQGALQGVEGASQVPDTPLQGAGGALPLPDPTLEGPQRLAVTQETPSYGQDGLGRSLGVGQARQGQAGVGPASTPQGDPQAPPQGVPQAATLTQEEVALLSQHQVTYQNGRWVHTELTAKGYISTFVNPRVELNKIIGTM